MADKAPDQEPSIEEILASIRQIISDDDEKPAAGPAPEAAASTPFPLGLSDAIMEPVVEPVAAASDMDETDDVLELTEMLPDDDIADKTPAAFADFMQPETPPETTVEPAPTPRRMEIDMRDMDTTPTDTPVADSREAVLTPQAASAALQGFAKLTSHMAVERSGNGVTIEDIVREQLKPMLREWLDGNLPQLIEKLVQKELERLSRRVQD